MNRFIGKTASTNMPDCPEGRDWGDAFVVAPDGSRAGIIWEVGEPVLEISIPPEKDQGSWGVYQLGFTRRVYNDEDLVQQLGEWLPELRRRHLMLQSEQSS